MIEGKPRKNLNLEIDPTGIEPGPAVWEVTMLLLDHSGGPFYQYLRVFHYRSPFGLMLRRTLNTYLQ